MATAFCRHLQSLFVCLGKTKKQLFRVDAERPFFRIVLFFFLCVCAQRFVVVRIHHHEDCYVCCFFILYNKSGTVSLCLFNVGRAWACKKEKKKKKREIFLYMGYPWIVFFVFLLSTLITG